MIFLPCPRPARAPAPDAPRACAPARRFRCQVQGAAPAGRSGSAGLSLVELILFIVVVAVALAGTLAVFTQATRGSADPQLRAQSLAIARSLLEEVRLAPFTWCDADDADIATATSAGTCASLPDALGPEAGETRHATPAFDHVDDYHGYSMSGISDLSGTAVTGLSGYSASVSVAPAALGSIGAGGDALRITITVTDPAGHSLVLEGWRTRHAPHAAL